MATLKESSGSGLVDKLSSSLRMDRIQYVQMNRQHQSSWTTCDRALLWTVVLFLFLGISFIVLALTQKDFFMKYDNDDVVEDISFVGQSTEWNEIIFTQLWGYSSCLQFKDRHPTRDVSCRYENQPSFWSIHGIWPTREGTEGPSFCTKVKFDVSQLTPIRDALDKYWYEIDSTKEGDYFWSHEWVKHGSCAVESSMFETELKYFGAGLDLRDKYDLFAILQNNNIAPAQEQEDNDASSFSLDQITTAIQSSLGSSAIPYIQCLGKKNHETNQMDYYLLAVELCFDRDLQQFVGCRTHKRLGYHLGDNALPCPPNVPIKYLSVNE